MGLWGPAIIASLFSWMVRTAHGVSRKASMVFLMIINFQYIEVLKNTKARQAYWQ